MPPDAIDLSLNEVETLAAKAARGAGLPWGVAEDTGRAAAWIARRAAGWAAPLLAVLDAAALPERSPLLVAGLLADTAAPHALPPIAWPLWALPGLLATIRHPVAIRIGTEELRCIPGESPTATVSADTLGEMQEAPLAIAYPTEPPAPLPHALAPRFRRGQVTAEDWQRLQALAQLTYVPATARSRLTGAGAGLLDDE